MAMLGQRQDLSSSCYLGLQPQKEPHVFLVGTGWGDRTLPPYIELRAPGAGIQAQFVLLSAVCVPCWLRDGQRKIWASPLGAANPA